MVSVTDVLLVGAYVAGGAGCVVWNIDLYQVDPWKSRVENVKKIVGDRAWTRTLRFMLVFDFLLWPILWPWTWWQAKQDDRKIP